MTDREPDLDDVDTDAQTVEPARAHHGGMPLKPDDEAYERQVAAERADLDVADYDPSAVPPATDVPVPADLTESADYQETLAEVRRQRDAGELIVEGQDAAFPPTRYSRD